MYLLHSLSNIPKALKMFVEFTFSTDKDAVMSVWKQSNTGVVALEMLCLFYLQTVVAPIQVVSVQCAAVFISFLSAASHSHPSVCLCRAPLVQLVRLVYQDPRDPKDYRDPVDAP